MKSRIFAFIIALAWFAGDYATKVWAQHALADKHTIVVNDWMYFVLAHNKGAAFSLFADGSGWQRWFFMGIAILVGLWLCYTIIFEKISPGVRIAYACILGGATGNLYDRVIHGYVIDFICWHVKQYYWPVFNLADVGISLGVGLLSLLWFIEWRRGRAKTV